MNDQLNRYIETQKQKEHNKKVLNLIELGILKRIYATPGTPMSKEWPYFDYRRGLAFRVHDENFTEEEYNEAIKYHSKAKSKITIKKILLAFYMIWVALHFVFLFWGSAGEWAPNLDDFLDIDGDIWPFGDSNLEDYDISEFLVYSLIPIFIYHIIKLFKQTTSE